MTSRRSIAAATVLFAAAVLTACSSSSDESLPSVTTLDAAAERGPYGVGVTSLEFVDTSRRTEALGNTQGAPERTLPVEVWYPAASDATSPEQVDAPLEMSDAPYPLIVLAHGISSAPRLSASYAQHLASHGYIVAAPEFPLTHLGTPGGTHLGDVLNQPGDVSFAIDEMLRLSGEGAGELAGSIDSEKIGVTGNSLGGLTAELAGYGQDRDDRIRAIVAVSPLGCFLGDATDKAGIPTLVIGGGSDLIVGRAAIRAGYDRIPPPKFWVEIAGADHARFVDVDETDEHILEMGIDFAGSDVQSEALQVIDATGADIGNCFQDERPNGQQLVTGDRQRELMRAFATPFFDAFLKDSEESQALFEELPELLPKGTVEFESEPADS